MNVTEVLRDAAERFRVAACPLAEAYKTNKKAIVPSSCQECSNRLGSSYCTEVLAILGNELKCCATCEGTHENNGHALCDQSREYECSSWRSRISKSTVRTNLCN